MDTYSVRLMGAKGKFRGITSPGWMVLGGLVARVLYILIAGAYRFDVAHWSIFEMANLAYSMAIGRGFSSPFGGDTGPSAFTAPLYPWVIWLAFRAFGVFSHSAAFALLLFNSVFAALTSWTIYRIARRVFNETVALWSGWIWALLPYSIYWSVYWVWETSLSAFLLSLLFMLTLEMEDDNRLWSWFRYGLLWAIVALTNTSMVAWLPFSGCWLAYQLHRRHKRFLVPVVLSALVFWAALMPWLARNYSVFGKAVFVRDAFGMNLCGGNNPQAEGWWVRTYLPSNNSILYQRYQQMGEAAFDTEQADQAKEWIAQHPKRFLVLSFRRFIFFWAGIPRGGLEQVKNLLFLASSLLAIGGLVLAAKRRVHGVVLFATLLFSYPLIYYITFPQPRYRHAIDPELVILAVFLISSIATLVRRGDQTDALSATISGQETPVHEKPALVLRLLRWAAIGVASLIVLVGFAVFNNNFSLTHPSRAAFNARLDASLDRAIAWIAANNDVTGVNPPIMYMVADIEKMTGDPRLLPVLEANVQTLHGRYAADALTPFWLRFAAPQAPLPFITTLELRKEGFDQRWFAYAIKPEKVHLSEDDLADLFSLTKYSWGARHHQVLGLIMYRDFNGDTEKVDDTLRRLCEKEARDQRYDFRVTDAYVQRNAFILAAGQPGLVRSRWIERILDNQTADGSWNYCWHGWGRGILEFGSIDPQHTTIQAAWALAQLKYRYPQWIDEHYH
jgi:4-amino-4-deoxy-L-arabinose transferase-like glycosyltransferase